MKAKSRYRISGAGKVEWCTTESIRAVRALFMSGKDMKLTLSDSAGSIISIVLDDLEISREALPKSILDIKPRK